jgi:AraC-like DNA-binding protein
MEPFELILSGHTVCYPGKWGSPGAYENCHRLYIPCAGRAEIFDHSHTQSIRTGHVYLIPGMRTLGYQCPVRFEVDWVHFRPRDLTTQAVLGRLPRSAVWPLKAWEFWRPVFTRLHELDKLDRQGSNFLHAKVQAMLLYFTTELLEKHPISSEHLGLQHIVNRLAPAVRFMDETFLDNPSLSTICASVNLSPTHFHRAFRAAFRTTPHDYMLRKRMDLAWSLLAGGQLNVSQVADRCRYVNVFYFSRVFHRYFDLPPSQVLAGPPARP